MWSAAKPSARRISFRLKISIRFQCPSRVFARKTNFLPSISISQPKIGRTPAPSAALFHFPQP